MSQPLRILIIDDDAQDRLLVERELARAFPELQVISVADAEQFAAALATGGFDLVITDFALGWTNGLEVLHAIKARDPNIPVLMFTGSGNEEVAVSGMKE